MNSRPGNSLGEGCRGREACDKMTSGVTGNMDLDAVNGGASMELDDRTGQPGAGANGAASGNGSQGLAALEANLVAMLQSLSDGNAAAGSSDAFVMDDISVRSNPLVNGCGRCVRKEQQRLAR